MANDFKELGSPHIVQGDVNPVGYYVRSFDDGLYLHNDRTLHPSIDRVTKAGRTIALFPSEDAAFLALNDYYVIHGEHTPVIRVGGVWRAAGPLNVGQTTNWINPKEDDVESQPMDFE